MYWAHEFPKVLDELRRLEISEEYMRETLQESILKASGLRVTSIKIDPYLNVDAGTMSPFEHGEVFVLDDGGEVCERARAHRSRLESNA